MIDYIKGKITEITPTMVVIENSGIGYYFEISLQSYSILEKKSEATIYLQSQINPREGTTVDYGFVTKEEREIFRLITSVSGMGSSSARMVLSSLSVDELKEALLSENINLLKSIKGIGLKTAQRMILELKDKIIKGSGSSSQVLFQSESNPAIEEATCALQMLGFSKPNINKAVQQIIKSNPNAPVEQIIKLSLKIL